MGDLSAFGVFSRAASNPQPEAAGEYARWPFTRYQVRLPPSARPEARNFCTGGVVARWSPGLSPNDQSLDQRLRQVGEPHAFLRRGDIVGNPPKFHHVVRQISNCKSSSRIPVARLSD